MLRWFGIESVVSRRTQTGIDIQISVLRDEEKSLYYIDHRIVWRIGRVETKGLPFCVLWIIAVGVSRCVISHYLRVVINQRISGAVLVPGVF